MKFLIPLMLLPIADYSPQQVMDQGTRHVMIMKQEPAAVVACIQKNASLQGGDLVLTSEAMERSPGALKVVVSPSNNRNSAIAVAHVAPVAGGSQTYMWITPNSYRSESSVADALWGGCAKPTTQL